MGKRLIVICFLIISSFSSVILAQIQFDPYIAIPTGSSADIVCIGDVNNDGLNDVVVGNGFYFDQENDFRILVYLQNSSGQLNSAIKYAYSAISTYPPLKTVKIVDIDNDSRNDIIVGYGNKVSIFYQNTVGTLDNPIIVAENTNVAYIDTGDLNHDGILDIVVSPYDGNHFSIIYQDASGNFNIVNILKPSSITYLQVVVADINGDGWDDIIFQRLAPTVGISIFLQNNEVYYHNAIAIFYEMPNTASPHVMHSMTTSDINNDGLIDIIASKIGNVPDSRILIWYQNALTHNLDFPEVFNAYHHAEALQVSDVDNDGIKEIVTVNGGWERVSCHQQTDNVFTNNLLNYIPYASHYDTGGLAIGDINNDSRKDIAIADYNNGLIILYNSTQLSVTTHTKSRNAALVTFPNPVDNTLHFTLPENDAILEDIVVAIFDTTGKCVLKNLFSKITEDNTVNVEKLAAGFYTITVEFDSVKLCDRFVKH
ncbi:MAG TPA: FG-GAP-like repeat-containing protein [Flavobacterium sp.]|jgi:hypothetical protein|nr:FG-GAP-like repeat-containing protein [Flavobacterium sp.]